MDMYFHISTKLSNHCHNILLHMEDQEQFMLGDQALQVLSLFPKRQISNLTPTLEVYSKLVTSLTCTICREILSNPVYLRCSHRFCKDCIERNIRCNPLKSCPNCKSDLTTKRELRYDSSIDSLIAFAFTDAKSMSKQLLQIDKSQPVEAEYENIVEMKKMQSMVQLKSKVGDIGQEYIVSSTSLKRNKTLDGQETKRKRSQKKIKADPQKEGASTRKVRQTQKNIKKQQPEYQLQVRRKKKNQVTVIEIESSDPVEVQQIPPSQFFQGEQNPSGQHPTNKLASLICSISMIPEVSEIESAKKITSMLQIQKQEAKHDLIQSKHEQKMDIEKPQQMIAEPLVSQQVRTSCQALKQQFGNNFLNKIIQLTDYNIYMRLRLKKHPAHPFTPSTTFFQIKIFAKITAAWIGFIIADDLNINKEAIKLFVCQEHTNNYIEVNLGTKMQEINNRFWRSFGGFQIIELSQKIIISDEDPMDRFSCAWQNRIIYYSIDYSKIIL